MKRLIFTIICAQKIQPSKVSGYHVKQDSGFEPNFLCSSCATSQAANKATHMCLHRFLSFVLNLLTPRRIEAATLPDHHLLLHPAPLSYNRVVHPTVVPNI